MDDDGGMDALFSTFMNEVSSMKSTKMKKIEERAGSPEEIIERLTATRYDPKQGYGSAYQMLQVSPEASDSEITKQYRKLSVLIHPDKCKLEKASEAFQVLVKAYNDTKDPNYQDKYKDVIGHAKDRVKKKREKENADRAKRGEDPLDMEGNEFDQEVLRECERMTTETTEAATYSNSVMEANMKRHEQMMKEAKAKRREEDAEKRKFEKNRDKRAAGWQVFLDRCESKKFKSQSWSKVGQVGAADVHHRREERKESDGKAQIDREDKKILKSDTQAGATGVDRSYRQAWR
uniref:J domain-containing protein n=1 Tax=Alexandrium monilatum TaxID=311494 RepID=A0A7S4SBZ5_9DINO